MHAKDFIVSAGGKKHGGRWLFTPIKPVTIKIRKLREDGSIFAALYHGEKLVAEEDLTNIEQVLNMLARNIAKQE